jgi:hypothetical protein
MLSRTVSSDPALHKARGVCLSVAQEVLPLLPGRVVRRAVPEKRRVRGLLWIVLGEPAAGPDNSAYALGPASVQIHHRGAGGVAFLQESLARCRHRAV